MKCLILQDPPAQDVYNHNLYIFLKKPVYVFYNLFQIEETYNDVRCNNQLYIRVQFNNKYKSKGTTEISDGLNGLS